MPNTLLTVTESAEQSTYRSGGFLSPIKVCAKDASGNPLVGSEVVFFIPTRQPGGVTGYFGSNSTTTAKTGSDGVATALMIRAGKTGGILTVNVVCEDSDVQHVQLKILEAAKITIASGDQQQTKIGTQYSSALSVKVLDNFGNPAADGVSVDFIINPTSTPNPTQNFAFFQGPSYIWEAPTKGGIATAGAMTATDWTGNFKVLARLQTEHNLSVMFNETNTS